MYERLRYACASVDKDIGLERPEAERFSPEYCTQFDLGTKNTRVLSLLEWCLIRMVDPPAPKTYPVRLRMPRPSAEAAFLGVGLLNPGYSSPLPLMNYSNSVGAA